MEQADSIALLVPNIDGQGTILISDTIVETELGNYDQQRHNTHSLIQVIEKLSKIVQTEKSKRHPMLSRKRSRSVCSTIESTKQVCDPLAKVTKLASTYPQETKDKLSTPSHSEKDYHSESYEKVTCYQCSLCKNILSSFLQLKQHLKEHDRPSGIQMCSQCCFTTQKHEELEAHTKSHTESIEISSENQQRQCVSLSNLLCSEHAEKDKVALNKQDPLESKETKPWYTGSEDSIGKRKWYTYEQYGMYRCLICSYTCGQQRMLKTHAWKHAGEVDCSYPIFEEEYESACLPDTGIPHADETILVLSSEQKQFGFHDGQPIRIQVCSPELVCKVPPKQSSTKESEVQSQSKAPTPTAEIVVEEEAVSDIEQEIPVPDSLLSSAQKIISCSPNTAGHLNVIVERLPSAEGNVSQKHFVINADTDPEKSSSADHHPLYDAVSPETYQIDKGIVQSEEIIVGWDGNEKQDDIKSNDFSQVDENTPPVRRRTNSESLRLHSLAAEALVTMPIRVAELTRANFKTIGEVRTLEPDTGQELANVSGTLQPTAVPSVENTPEDLTDIKQNDASFVDFQHPEDKKCDSAEVPAKMGISMSLLTVIEKLRERTDQNASDEDILKELLDNAQCQASSDAILPGGNLVEYIPNAERPYRCRLCHYSSGNKGYLKQHLRVHRQRQPYQCPICEHIADDSKGLESHMINHCKTRMYHCKQCDDTFYYKSQLRNHEREQHLPDCVSAVSPTIESASADKGAEERSSPEGDVSSVPKVHRCDICDYTSTTYVGVRNHRRIHSSEKPYRCSSCDFATTNMNSLKCHMRRHPQDHKAKQLTEQYKCSLCGYVCSHPPSLKSHMWKHASDQNYNYEQMNKAINEAISQSTRFQGDPQIRTFVEAISETACTVGISDKSVPCGEVTNQTVNGVTDPNRNLNLSTTRNTSVSLERNLGQPQITGMEYVLLFCCCICGFESTSKGHLIDHMKEHEGEIINIIRNKDQHSPAFQNNKSNA